MPARTVLVVDEIHTELDLSQLERFVLRDALSEYTRRHPRKLVGQVASDILNQLNDRKVR